MRLFKINFEVSRKAEKMGHPCVKIKVAVIEAAMKQRPRIERKSNQKWMTEDFLNSWKKGDTLKKGEKYETLHKEIRKNVMKPKKSGSMTMQKHWTIPLKY